MLLRTFEPFRASFWQRAIIGPMAVFSGIRVVHYAGDVA